ncbi:hypothetical protein WG66_011810 [Moniliophthora roreri]|nr:hypothetical protein WG66_011810 [Moniliophthora roreri]
MHVVSDEIVDMQVMYSADSKSQVITNSETPSARIASIQPCCLSSETYAQGTTTRVANESLQIPSTRITSGFSIMPHYGEAVTWRTRGCRIWIATKSIGTKRRIRTRRFESLGYCGLYRRFREVLGLLVQVSQAAKVTFPRAQELLALSRNPEKFLPILYHRSLFNRNRQVVD